METYLLLTENCFILTNKLPTALLIVTSFILNTSLNLEMSKLLMILETKKSIIVK